MEDMHISIGTTDIYVTSIQCRRRGWSNGENALLVLVEFVFGVGFVCNVFFQQHAASNKISPTNDITLFYYPSIAQVVRVGRSIQS